MSRATVAMVVGALVDLLFLGWLYGLGHVFSESTARYLMFPSLVLLLGIAVPVFLWRMPESYAGLLALLASAPFGALHLWLAMNQASPVLTITKDLRVERGIVFRAGTTHGIEVTARGGGFKGDTTIVNASDRPLVLTGVTYGYGGTPDGPGTGIPPHTVLVIKGKPQHVGPDDRPPEAIESESYLETRRWLTW